MAATIVCNVSNAKATISYGTDYAEVTLKTNTGYVFDGTPNAVLTFDDPFADEVEIDLSVNTGNNVATGQVMSADVEEDCTITFTGNTKQESKPVPTFTNTIENTDWVYVYDTDRYKITIDCTTGFVFDGTPYINYKNLETEVQGTANLTLSDDNGTGYVEIITSEYTDLTAIGSTKEYITPTSVVNNVTNAEYSGSVSGTIVNGKLTATETNGAFVGVTAKYTDTTTTTETEVNLSPSSSFDTSLRVTLSSVLKGSVVTLSGSYRGVCKTENNTTGCSILNLKDYYIEGESVNIALSADEGTSFSDTDKPKLIWYDVLSTPTEVEFTLSDDRKKANLNWTMPTNRSDIEYTSLEITGSTTPDTTITGYGSINVYLVDTAALDSFATARFKYKDTTETGLTPDGDLGEYVNRLHKVYCPVGETTATTIKCGNNDTQIACKSINNAVVHIDFGFVRLPSYNNDKSDMDTSIRVFVPFVGFVDVSGEYSGEDVYLSYDIDLVTGEGCHKLETESVVITTGICDCSNDIIYRTSQTETLNTIGSSKFSSTYLLGLKPYATIKHYNNMGWRTNETSQVITIGDVTGFAKFDDVNVNITCLADEQAEIQNLLSTGVIL